jgi:hypothetical protein
LQALTSSASTVTVSKISRTAVRLGSSFTLLLTRALRVQLMKRFWQEEQVIIDRQLSMVWFVASSTSPLKAFSVPERNNNS